MFHRHYLIQSSKLPQEAEILFIISILWMKKLRLREETQGHTLFTTTPYCLSVNFPLLKSVRTCSVCVSNSLKPHELQPARLPYPWDSPSNNTGVGCHFLLQGIFPPQGSNPHLLFLLLSLILTLHWQLDSLPLESPGKPVLQSIGVAKSRTRLSD